MSRAWALLLFFAVASLHAQPSCPAKAPNSFGMAIRVSCDLCVAGQPVTFTLVPDDRPCFFQPYDCVNWGPYSVQSCDTVQWSFNDGTAVAPVLGSPSVVHTFSSGGIYDVSARVSNALGAASFPVNARVPVGNAHPTILTVSVPSSIAEGDGAIAITLARSGELAAATDVIYNLYLGSGWRRHNPASGEVHFAPGESQKVLSFPLLNADGVWTGLSKIPFDVVGKDATLIAGLPKSPTNPTAVFTILEVADDDRRPKLRLEGSTVLEGDANLTFAPIRATLDVPSGLSHSFSVGLAGVDAVGAGAGPDFQGFPFARLDFLPGQTIANASIMVIGDRLPEPDETFVLDVRTLDSDAAPLVEQGSAPLTILNDDIGFGAPAIWMSVGESQTLPLDLGAPLPAGATLTLTADMPSAVRLTPSVSAGSPAGTLTIDALKGVDTWITARLETPQRAATGTLLVNILQVSTLVARPAAVQLRVGEETPLRVSFAPAQAAATMVTAHSQSPGIVSVLESASVAPPDGDALFLLRGVALGKTSLIVHAPGQPASTLVPVEVVAGTPRRRAAKP